MHFSDTWFGHEIHLKINYDNNNVYYNSISSYLYSVSGSSDSLKSLDSKRFSILAQNTLQIIVLCVDSLVNIVGGVKSLVSESCNVGEGKNSKKLKSVRREVSYIYKKLIIQLPNQEKKDKIDKKRQKLIKKSTDIMTRVINVLILN